MKLIENITADEIRINMQRQANNLYDQVGTMKAISELQDGNQIVDNMTFRSYSKMKKVIEREAKIVDAVREKIRIFQELTEKYEEAHPEGESEYGVDDVLTEASAEHSTH